MENRKGKKLKAATIDIPRPFIRRRQVDRKRIRLTLEQELEKLEQTREGAARASIMVRRIGKRSKVHPEGEEESISEAEIQTAMLEFRRLSEEEKQNWVAYELAKQGFLGKEHDWEALLTEELGREARLVLPSHLKKLFPDLQDLRVAFHTAFPKDGIDDTQKVMEEDYEDERETIQRLQAELEELKNNHKKPSQPSSSSSETTPNAPKTDTDTFSLNQRKAKPRFGIVGDDWHEGEQGLV